MSTTAMAVAAGTGLAMYAGHHIGDYWVQTDHQASHKGLPGSEGVLQCLLHVISYVATQTFMLILLSASVGLDVPAWSITLALAVSGVTHYLADRREHGLMFKLARLIPGKEIFLKMGRPRGLYVRAFGLDSERTREVALDNPSPATGAWALDQAWHIFFGVFIPALILGAAA